MKLGRGKNGRLKKNVYLASLGFRTLHSYRVQTKLFNTGKAVKSCLLIVAGIYITVVICREERKLNIL